LLTVQAHDTKLHQLDHKKATLPARGELAKVHDQRERASEDLATSKAHAGDIQRELTKVEDEVSKVEVRRTRDVERLESGGGLSRELQALQAEIEALERRRDNLEEAALEVMERLDEAQNEAKGHAALVTSFGEQIAELEAGLAKETAQIDKEEAEESALRAEAVAGLDTGLVTLYERLRVKGGGVGAAALRGRRCMGCQMELNPGDLAVIAAAGPDDVVRCEECGRILVRGEDSAV
jgi:predicted  nucleic acid-binding Zn-ribbon protein